MPVAAGVLYPAFGLLLSPLIAGAGDEPEFGIGGRQCLAALRPEAAMKLSLLVSVGLAAPDQAASGEDPR